MEEDEDSDGEDRPQDSPATRAKRTTSKLDYQKYYDNVKAVHQDGAFGSIGYRYPYNDAETKRLVLRTHTTAISAYCLHRLAANPRPCRYFSIDRVFRNETVDATHLAEFHQIEGVIADFGLTLGGLQAFLKRFFRKIGVPDLKFKPAYNPYTEPSMEVFAWHEGLNKLVSQSRGTRSLTHLVLLVLLVLTSCFRRSRSATLVCSGRRCCWLWVYLKT